MAYADQQGMSSNRMVSIVVVVLLHAFLGYALVTGLAFEAVKKVAQKMDVIDVEEEKPKEEEPPPPDEKLPPPPEVVVPPSPFPRPAPAEQPTTSNKTDQPPPSPGVTCADGSKAASASQCAPVPERVTCWNGQVITRPAVCPPEPKKENKSKKASPANSKGGWVTTADYPESEVRAKRQGVTSFTVTVGPDGRVQSCSGSGSGSARLDSIACQKIKSRARFNPALDEDGNKTSGTYSSSILWQLPKE